MSAPAPDLSSGPHHLQNQWTVWEHVEVKSKNASAAYNAGMKQLLSFTTVEDFWRWFNNYPKPSQIFFDGRNKKMLMREGEPEGKCINSLSVFKKGIRPEWEDPANRSGAEWCLRRVSDLATLDGYWENLMLGVIGETMDNDDEICGLRVVDKSKNGRCDFRVELWLRRQDRMVGNIIRGKAEAAMAEGQRSMNSINLQWKVHKAY